MSEWKCQCPLCGQLFSVEDYDPADLEDAITLVKDLAFGHGEGAEPVEKHSLLDGSDPELLDLISDRVAVIFDLLYEDEEDDEEEDDDNFESLSALDKELLLAKIEEDEKLRNLQARVRELRAYKEMIE